MQRSKSNRAVVLDGLSLPSVDQDFLSAKGLGRAEFVRRILERFLKQYVDSPLQGWTIQDLVWGNKPDQVTVEEHFEDSHRTS